MTVKKIAILTSGGDAPGMNSAIKAIVNTCINKGIEPYLVYEGYKGLTAGNFHKVDKSDVYFIDQLSGTKIFSSRFVEFKDKKIRQLAVNKLRENNIDSLIAIGGDGTYMGAAKLSEMGINTVCLPGTIDNDIVSTEYTIGFASALETITEAIDQIKTTSQSHNRANVIEVMGRYCGDLALYAAIAAGAQALSIPERKLSEEEIINLINEARLSGHRAIIVIVTEHLYKDVNKLVQRIEKETKIETRATILGHIQRGANPTATDRFLAASMGMFAVDQLIKNKNKVAINLVNNKLETKDILEVVKMKQPSKEHLLAIYDAVK